MNTPTDAARAAAAHALYVARYRRNLLLGEPFEWRELNEFTRQSFLEDVDVLVAALETAREDGVWTPNRVTTSRHVHDLKESA